MRAPTADTAVNIAMIVTLVIIVAAGVYHAIICMTPYATAGVGPFVCTACSLEQEPGSDCGGDGLDTYDLPVSVEVPDDDPDGVVLGPISLRDAAASIDEVRLELEIEHPYTGELAVALLYDRDNDGIIDARTPIEFHLARLGRRLEYPGAHE